MKKSSLLLCLGIFLLQTSNSPAADVSVSEATSECIDCHASTKTVGLGEGTVFVKDGEMYFEGVDKGVTTASGQTVPFDSYVDLEGKAQQHSSRPDLRPFNKKELKSILRVGLCVRCHNRYDDPIWKSYNETTECVRIE